MKLTQSQREAIDHKGGNLQLIACAGSGKTEVVARRVAELLRSSGVKPANIIAFTFADEAAAELKDRIGSRCREEHGEITGLADLFVGTIHAFCLELLVSEVPEFMKYEVLNEVQQALLVDRHSIQSGLTSSTDLKGKALSRYTDTDRYIEALSILRESNLREERLKSCSVVDGLKKYEELLRSRKHLDYSAIVVEAVRTIDNDLGLRQRLGSRIKHVIVDEYQDVNPIQEQLILLLHQAGATICVVGDDDQTIYQWRGTDVTNILNFHERYSHTKKVFLEDNFRSSRGIVQTASHFIRNNVERMPKNMVNTDAQSYEEGDIVALSFSSPTEEAEFISDTIEELQGIEIREKNSARGISYSDVAILLRSVRANGKPIVDSLKRNKIPFVVVGMNNLFEAHEAEAARQLFYYMACRPAPSAHELEQIWSDANLGVSKKKVKEAVKKARESRNVIISGKEKRFHVYSLQRTFRSFLEDLGLREEAVTAGKEGASQGEIVFYNLGKFSQLISDFEAIHFRSEPKRKYDEFASFLQFRAEDAYPEGWQDRQCANLNAVRVMTVHQAKGTEWPVVFIPALLKNRFPSKKMGGRNVWHLIPRDAVVGQARFEGSIEDERRLFYVSMTRSKKFLYLTWAPVPSSQLFQKPSEFWEDVLVSKHVKRRTSGYSNRRRGKSVPKEGVSNVVFSFSDVKYFFECPYQFKLRIMYGFNPPLDEAIGYGRSLHNALAEVHKRAMDGMITVKGGIPKLVGTHLYIPYAYPDLEKTLRQSAEEVLGKYLKDNEKLLANIEFAEKTVEVNMGDGVSVRGRIDLVRRLDTDETTIVDLKCSPRAQAENVTEVQLHVYAMGYRELTGRDADFVEVYELDEGRRKPRAVDDSLMLDVKQKVREAAHAMRTGQFPRYPDSARCKGCDFNDLCSSSGTSSV